MSNIQQNLVTSLRKAAKGLRETGLSSELAVQMEELAQQVNEPCVVAVVGRVKAGKSTLINALLGEELAKVGTTETTATINYFRYGHPNNPDRPVGCHWRDGRYTEVDRHFLDELQGHDEETLRRADRIAYLEYYLAHPFLKQATLVDTPGTGAVVHTHQKTTAGFMRLSQETQKLGDTADAVIYLIGEVARATDYDFLKAFQQVTQGKSRALNAIGVMAKIDEYLENPEKMADQKELAEKVAERLKNSLNTVVPVSAGIRRALDGLLEKQQAGLQRMISVLRTIPPIPPKTLEELLSSDELYLDEELDDCPLSTKQRQELWDDMPDMPWKVFTTIARVAADPTLDESAVVARLNEIAGFDQLQKLLEQHFFKRGHFLRSYRIVSDARQVLQSIKFTQLRQFGQRNRQEKAKLRRFLTFIRQTNGGPDVAQELEAYLQERLTGLTEQRNEVTAVIKEVEHDFGRIFHQLKQHNQDFQALQQLENHPHHFSAPEQEELRALLGLYGLESQKRLLYDDVSARQQVWLDIEQRARSYIRRKVAERAVYRYGVILKELIRN